MMTMMNHRSVISFLFAALFIVLAPSSEAFVYFSGNSNARLSLTKLNIFGGLKGVSNVS
jgi:hypothetical protein